MTDPPPHTVGWSGRKRSRGAVTTHLAMVAVLVVGAVSCGRVDDSSGGPSTTGSSTTTTTGSPGPGTFAPTTPDVGLGEGWGPIERGRTPLRGFGEVVVTITDASGRTCAVCLLAATEAAQHERGLMEVTDPELGGYDGMIFEYAEPFTGGFWMRNTPMPLAIAYFDQDLELVSTAEMEPCADSGACPTYPPDGPSIVAIEVPQGKLADLRIAPGSTLTIGARTCPVAEPTS